MKAKLFQSIFYRPSIVLLIFLPVIINCQNFVDVSPIHGISEYFGTGYAGGGISQVDFNLDGFTDLTFGTEEGREIVFYQNNAGAGFTKISLGINDVSHQKQVTWVDLDNDGDLDFYLAGYHSENKIYLNNGDLTFTDISASSGILQQADDTYGTVFGDIDLDGDLDIYISNHDNYPSQLYVNNGDNTFSNITNSSGISQTSSLNFYSVFFDFDKDGDLDLYKINDKLFNNEFYLNNGDLTFQEATGTYGGDIQIDAMAAAIADMNNDGLLDIYMSNSNRSISSGNLIPGNVLLKNAYPNPFVDLTSSSQTNFTDWCWGSSWADFDNDGWQDIYTSNEGSGPTFNFRNALFFNNGNETFSQQSPSMMVGDNDRSHTCSVGDFNNDGKIDIAVQNSGSVNFKLWENRINNSNSYLQVELEGVSSNSNGVGSWINVYANNDEYTRFTHCGIGYLSQESYKNHIGIGLNSSIDSVVINWPSGIVDKIISPIVNGCIRIVEGSNDYTVVTNSSNPSLPPLTNPMYSVARNWMELLLESIRNDFARPTIHARNLFHSSIAMYDAWATYQNVSIPYFLGQTHGSYFVPFVAPIPPADVEAARREAISFAMYRLLSHRFQSSPAGAIMQDYYDQYMEELGYDISFTSQKYVTDGPAALGNYLANQLIQFGLQDGSNEANDYANLYYQPINPALVMNTPGNPNIVDLDRWQPLTLDVFIDQAGNPIPVNTPDFLSPEWGNVIPFALQQIEKKTFTRNGNNYQVYCDPGIPPLSSNSDLEAYLWGFSLVAAWSSHLDSNDQTMWDISPASIGNITSLPNSYSDYPSFYNLTGGGDASVGHAINPSTNSPYQAQLVKRADYARVLAEFWADGPDSETPPGHWFDILNHVTDHPQIIKRYQGTGPIIDDLEWDVKAYFSLGGPMHDAAISAWGIKGWYDYIRPVSAIRALAELGQSSNPSLPSYHVNGIPLIPGFIELVGANDPLVGPSNENLNKIKLYSWKGPDFITNPDTDEAGVDWILAENWWPYQRPSFVTPPFAGYVSGHSTFSRAAAEVLTSFTGDAFFPGGVGEFFAEKDNFLVFENGPSDDIILQWATYRDASDQCSLSRIWGGIHPPADDIPGRIIGEKIGTQGFNYARHYILGTICDNLLIENNNPIPESWYKAQEIQSAGKVITPNVSFEGSQLIDLMPGFEVKSDAQFSATITGCN